ncbi:putative tRNA modification GTPase GTPBP3, mitochondrial [Apostichopus japonicus]|uniref:Putative tRNA modification GTPase GTPBP3, mitochondrial n=1 Tax=Stichopus japonicus TaxID=307972 RepID=A0A2G8KC40_STIJA|nr:putative tRNA modification GTPase GTPBP3, mitochondrial [Apostichopus japonicus]
MGRSVKTIYALSSGQGPAGLAVIRASGPRCSDVLKEVTKQSHLPRPRMAVNRDIFSPLSGELLDKSIVLWFPGPNSFTGDDVCEFHVHGGLAVIQAVLRALGNCEDLYQAEPGEFTKRAFINGKLDLTEVEGLGDLVAAETETQRQQALRQMSGELGSLYGRWRNELVKVVAHVEAFIDFSEDENIEGSIVDQAMESLKKLEKSIRVHLSDNRRGERLRNGVQIAIIGEPNAGKSSLLNILCKRPAAIVTSIAGTTRDVVESAVNLGGYPVLFSDTAGIRETSDLVELEGVKRATERAQTSDMVVTVVDASTLQPLIKNSSEIDDLVTALIRQLGTLQRTMDKAGSITDEIAETTRNDTNTTSQQSMVLFNKVDLLAERERKILKEVMNYLTKDQGFYICGFSCKTLEGLDTFLEMLKGTVSKLCGDPLSGNPSLTQERHRTHLELCLAAMSKVKLDSDLVIDAEHLREALRHLGRITGHVRVEEVLDVIFKDFCIGK